MIVEMIDKHPFFMLYIAPMLFSWLCIIGCRIIREYDFLLTDDFGKKNFWVGVIPVVNLLNCIVWLVTILIYTLLKIQKCIVPDRKN